MTPEERGFAGDVRAGVLEEDGFTRSSGALGDGGVARGTLGGRRRGCVVIGPEESDGEEATGDGAEGVVEGVGAVALEVIAVDGRCGAKFEGSAANAHVHQFLEPFAAEDRVRRAKVREHPFQEDGIVVVHGLGKARGDSTGAGAGGGGEDGGTSVHA